METHDHSQQPDEQPTAPHDHGAHDHTPNPRGRAFFWGGSGAGVVLVVLLLTHGFGLWAGGAGSGEQTPALVHRGEKIFVPETSPLRRRLTVEPAPQDLPSWRVAPPPGSAPPHRPR